MKYPSNVKSGGKLFSEIRSQSQSQPVDSFIKHEAEIIFYVMLLIRLGKLRLIMI